jgi:hypothetical protein
LRAVFNSSWTRGQGVLRCDPHTNELRLYPTFTPKLLVMKGQNLPDTTRTRCICIMLTRKTPDEEVQDFEYQDDEHFAQLRRQLLRWSLDNAEALKAAKPEDIPGFHNRRRMNYKGLLAIAELAGGDVKQKAWAAIKEIEDLYRRDSASIGIEALRDIQKVFNNLALERGERGEIFTKDLISLMAADDEGRWKTYGKDNQAITDRQLARLLKPYNIYSRDLYPQGANGPRGKGYQRDQFTDAWTRFLEPEDVEPDDVEHENVQPADVRAPGRTPGPDPRTRVYAEKSMTSEDSDPRIPTSDARTESGAKRLENLNIRGYADEAPPQGEEKKTQPRPRLDTPTKIRPRPRLDTPTKTQPRPRLDTPTKIRPRPRLDTPTKTRPRPRLNTPTNPDGGKETIPFPYDKIRRRSHCRK